MSAKKRNFHNTAKWKEDIARSVDLYNRWYMEFAPKAYLNARKKTTEKVKFAFDKTQNLSVITAKILGEYPVILSTLRMSTCPPLARDRLMNLAELSSNTVKKMEEGKIPRKISDDDLKRIVRIVSKLLDPTILEWLSEKSNKNSSILRAASVVADRLCGSEADPIIRNEQEKRQLDLMSRWLENRGYRKFENQTLKTFSDIPIGSYGIRFNLPVESDSANPVNIPVDLVVRPLNKPKSPIILVEAKSAGDYANVNKRRKEEAQKMTQLKREYGNRIKYILFLCGYFDAGYLGYEAAEEIDWVWEHRIDDFEYIGL